MTMRPPSTQPRTESDTQNTASSLAPPSTDTALSSLDTNIECS